MSDDSARPPDDPAPAARDGDLTGRVLIAMPGMRDPRFARSVILVCAHSEDGALGLVLNRPLDAIDFPSLLSQLDIAPTGGDLPDIEIRAGGPIEPGRGFVLHPLPEGATAPEGTMRIGPRLGMTTTRDILVALARGEGPDRAVLSLGYAGWAPGQLESEMAGNGWLTGSGADALVFGRDHAGKWAGALRAEGIDPALLSAAAGHA